MPNIKMIGLYIEGCAKRLAESVRTRRAAGERAPLRHVAGDRRIYAVKLGLCAGADQPIVDAIMARIEQRAREILAVPAAVQTIKARIGQRRKDRGEEVRRG